MHNLLMKGCQVLEQVLEQVLVRSKSWRGQSGQFPVASRRPAGCPLGTCWMPWGIPGAIRAEKPHHEAAGGCQGIPATRGYPGIPAARHPVSWYPCARVLAPVAPAVTQPGTAPLPPAPATQLSATSAGRGRL